jgi:hypothetical protein
MTRGTVVIRRSGYDTSLYFTIHTRANNIPSLYPKVDWRGFTLGLLKQSQSVSGDSGTRRHCKGDLY